MVISMLKERHYTIIKELERSKRPISARELSERLGISIRTIRYDINKIADYIKYNTEATFIRIPGVGMRIQAPDNIVLSRQESKLTDFINFSQKEKEYCIVYFFALQNDYVSSDYLATVFDVSKSTIMNLVKRINEDIKKYHIEITGKRKYGLSLVGSNKSIFRYLVQNDTILSNNSNLFHLIFSQENSPFMNDVPHLNIKLIDKIIMEMNAVTLDYYGLYSTMFFLLKAAGNKSEDYWRDTNDAPQIIYKIEKIVHFHIHNSFVAMFIYVFSKYTDYVGTNFEDEYLLNIIERLIGCISIQYPEILDHHQQLKHDLLTHLRSVFNRIVMDIREENSLLAKIKVKYYGIFESLKREFQIIGQENNISFTDDEIGFVTLYFAQSIEKTQEAIEANVIILCNLGRGAAKLLSSRIINNLPEIHVLGIGSPQTLEKYSHIENNVDLVLTTIPIETDFPSIVVSPLMTDYEIQKIRDTIYRLKTKHNLNVNLKEVDEKLITDLKSSYQDLTHIDAEMNAEIVLETILMYEKLSVLAEPLNRLAGMLTHVIMSIPRWQSKRFITTNDLSTFLNDYPFHMKLILEYLNKLEKIIDITIPSEEAVAIIRYII